MKNHLAVLNSNQRTKDGYVLDLKVLEAGLWQSTPYGMPSNLGHDFHRPIGWVNPFGLFLEPNLIRTVGNLSEAENEDDQKQIATGRYNALVNRVQKLLDKWGNVFKPLIQKHLAGNGKYIEVNALACVNSGIAERMFPFLLDYKVKDDLIPIAQLLSEFTYLGQGAFGHKNSDLIIFASSFFRRSLSRHNNFHSIFLDQFIAQGKNKDVTLKIAIDWDMIGFKPSFLHGFEFEFWWGPKYSDDIKSIEVGLCRYQCDELERLYYGVSSTEFFWKSNGNLHEFELEELREEPGPTLPADNYACRYVHSIYDKDNGHFNHFDGAIRMYDGDLMLERISQKMTEFGRRSKYTKIFRIDGKLTLGDWKSLTTNYLQGNPLIYEYFGLKKPKGSEVLRSREQSLKEKYVPFSIDKGDGIRLMISYHQKNSETRPRVVLSTDLLTAGEESREFIEYDIIEYVKSLRRLGLNIILPQNALYGYAEDLYWNIPCIFHGAELPQDDINNSIKAFRSIIDSLEKRKMEKVISFTVAWNHLEKEIRLSVLGHTSDLSKWFCSFDSIPTERSQLIKWIERQAQYLNTIKIQQDKPELSELAQFDGQLYLKRKNVSPEFEPVSEHRHRQVLCSIKVPANRKDVITGLNEQVITPVCSFICEQATCGKCGEEYWNCDDSYILDLGVQTIPRANLFGFFWTDKPSQPPLEFTYELGGPVDFSSEELKELAHLINSGGQIPNVNMIHQGLAASHLIGVIKYGNKMVCTATIKSPRKSYVNRVIKESKADGLKDETIKELGYISAAEGFEGRKLCQNLLQIMLDRDDLPSIFATTRKPEMLHILTKFNFKVKGQPYKDGLLLLVRMNQK